MKKVFLNLWLLFALGTATTVFNACSKGGGGKQEQTPTFENETFTVEGVTFTMVAVEAGTFMMGAQATDTLAANYDADAHDSESPVHQVTLTKNYYLGETEVTQALWTVVMGSNPSYFAGKATNPVEQVSWDDVQEFIAKLNEKTGKTFRLPTEAEWEYAARGGKSSAHYKYSGSNTVGDVAWYWEDIPGHTSGEAGYGTQQVKTKAANELGLYDMSGNVWELCSDWYVDYSNNAQTDPVGTETGSYRVVRGGSWYDLAWFTRVSSRYDYTPDNRDNDFGFRLALSAE